MKTRRPWPDNGLVLSFVALFVSAFSMSGLMQYVGL